ncbi:uncharacterized protein LOC117318274 [Pecten maximus]|uniref:uncharacterized protein LOC117318274 n=1 Tax=Pecten maximus TaxID=6579 RepID=UPI001458A8CF|nr:uncharacterized protein LOC117318274 [Pecten maximus]
MAEKLATAVIAEMFLEDSDDEESTDDIPLLLMVSFLVQGDDKSRISGYTEDVVPFYTVDSFRRMFRINIETYKILLGYMEALVFILLVMEGGNLFPSTGNYWSLCDLFAGQVSKRWQMNHKSFKRRNGFPNIIGAIVGTHIEIKAPTSHPQSYVNRKGYHSIQLQCVCMCNMAFSIAVNNQPNIQVFQEQNAEGILKRDILARILQ